MSYFSSLILSWFNLNIGEKKLPKKKKQQKTSFACYSVVNSQKKNNVARRVLSARLHKVKELKNEVCVLKNKLEASSMENQVLKRLQYRHLRAIAKYENAEINLPDLLEKHSREVRTLRVLLRKSQEQERNASRKLREAEIQLLKTKDAFQALQKLCKDKHLAGRGELQSRLAALTERMEASDKRIQVKYSAYQGDTVVFLKPVRANKIVLLKPEHASLIPKGVISE